jgi:hypothetical protein
MTSLRGHPVRLFFSPETWAATVYLGSYLVIGSALFAICCTVLAVCTALNVLVIGLPLLIGAAGVVRVCAHIERGRAWLVRDPIPAGYRPVSGNGIIAQLRVRWTDPATYRDCAYLVLLFPLLLVLDAGALLIWLTLLAGITIPLWFWAIPNHAPGHQAAYGLHLGPPAFGVWIGSLPSALIAAIVFACLCLAGVYLVTAAARMHGRIANALLRPYLDPLAEAKRILAEPGPLVSASVHASFRRNTTTATAPTSTIQPPSTAPPSVGVSAPER